MNNIKVKMNKIKVLAIFGVFALVSNHLAWVKINCSIVPPSPILSIMKKKVSSFYRAFYVFTILSLGITFVSA
jgi:hypothetical protein